MTAWDFFLVDAKALLASVILRSKIFIINNAFCGVFRSYTVMNKEGWKVMFNKINVSQIIVTVSLQQLNRCYCYQIFYLYDYDWHSWLQWFTLIINFPIFGVSKNHSALSKHDKYFNLQQFDIEEISLRFKKTTVKSEVINSLPGWQHSLGVHIYFFGLTNRADALNQMMVPLKNIKKYFRGITSILFSCLHNNHFNIRHTSECA